MDETKRVRQHGTSSRRTTTPLPRHDPVADAVAELEPARRRRRRPEPLVRGYVRVSSLKQADTGAGLAAQRTAITEKAEALGLDLAVVVEDAGVSGALPGVEREGLGPLLADMRPDDVLVVAKIDRLGRDVRDLLALVDRAHDEGWRIIFCDLDVDTSTPQGRFMTTVIGAVAELERGYTGQRTAAALAERRAQGVRTGRPPQLPQPLRHRIAAERRGGDTYTAIAVRLNAEGVPTARGGRWWPSTIQRVCESVALDDELKQAAETV